ncbi:hypothetical protein DPEC_G00281270, partial [Dallia pectoralis]
GSGHTGIEGNRGSLLQSVGSEGIQGRWPENTPVATSTTTEIGLSRPHLLETTLPRRPLKAEDSTYLKTTQTRRLYIPEDHTDQKTIQTTPTRRPIFIMNYCNKQRS